MRRHAVVAALLVVLLAIAPALIATTPSADAAPKRTNLLINPGAEIGLCTTSGLDAMTVPGWTVTAGSPDSVCYGSVGFPRSTIPGPAVRGRAFFAGGATGDADPEPAGAADGAAPT